MHLPILLNLIFAIDLCIIRPLKQSAEIFELECFVKFAKLEGPSCHCALPLDCTTDCAIAIRNMDTCEAICVQVMCISRMVLLEQVCLCVIVDVSI